MNLKDRLVIRTFFLFSILCSHFLVGACSSFVDLKKIADQYRLKISQNTNTATISLKNEKHTFCFSPKSKEACIDNVKVFLTYPLEVTSITAKRRYRRRQQILDKRQTSDTINRYSIARVDVEKIILPLLLPRKTVSKAAKIIVIDPGHGGKADGTQNKRLGIKEKDLTLKTARMLEENLKRLGYVVFLTRNQDIDLTLEQRSKFANQKKADLFLSLHYNSAPSLQAQGIETFAYSFYGHPSIDGNCKNDKRVAVHKFDGANTYLAWCLQKKLCQELGANDRGVRRGRMAVLGGLDCPGVLVECGFLSHDGEASKLKTEAYQKRLINAISHAIQCFKNNIN